MKKKYLHIITIAAMLCLLFILPLEADAASRYKLTRVGLKMQCIDLETDTPVTSTFVKTKGYSYYFDAKGYAHTGWLKYGKDYYFFNANGAMQKKRWVGQYYLRSNGKMAVSRWVTKTQYVGEDGKLIPGYQKKAKAKFVKTSKGKKYRNYDGTYSTKTWQCIKGHWYYFYSSGIMAANRKIGDYYVGKNGRMLVNKSVCIEKYRYYYGSDGTLKKKIKVK